MISLSFGSDMVGFNTQPPEGGWIIPCRFGTWYSMFQHTAARRRLDELPEEEFNALLFQHTAARRRLGGDDGKTEKRICFNTQPPEGGWHHRQPIRSRNAGFNTQPPEGGWVETPTCRHLWRKCFNTQPPEGGWKPFLFRFFLKQVSTHSRPKAAGSLLGTW